jgi:hypothetical protein
LEGETLAGINFGWENLGGEKLWWGKPWWGETLEGKTLVGNNFGGINLDGEKLWWGITSVGVPGFAPPPFLRDLLLDFLLHGLQLVRGHALQALLLDLDDFGG